MSSTDRTDQYPEVGGEEAGLVPQMRAEWPKKIRTLTATELDRLTIDSGGRFYWDGHLVNYEGPKPEARSADSGDAGALDILDRAAMELTGKTLPSVEAVKDPMMDLNIALNASELPRGENRPADVQAVELTQPAPVSPPVISAPSPDYPMLIAPSVHAPEKLRFSLSVWQSVGAVALVLSFLLGAAGLAAQGWIAANEWGCRIGAVKACPPPPPAPKVPARHDIAE